MMYLSRTLPAITALLLPAMAMAQSESAVEKAMEPPVVQPTAALPTPYFFENILTSAGWWILVIVGGAVAFFVLQKLLNKQQ